MFYTIMCESTVSNFIEETGMFPYSEWNDTNLWKLKGGSSGFDLMETMKKTLQWIQNPPRIILNNVSNWDMPNMDWLFDQKS